MKRLVISVDEAAKLLALSRSSTYGGVRRGEIPSVRVGRRLLIPRAALERLLAGGAPQGRAEEDARA